MILRPGAAALCQSDRGEVREGGRGNFATFKYETRLPFNFLNNAVRPREKLLYVIGAEYLSAAVIYRLHSRRQQQRHPTRTIDNRRISGEPFAFDATLISDTTGVAFDELPHCDRGSADRRHFIHSDSHVSFLRAVDDGKRAIGIPGLQHPHH